jgi:G1/S-specific cyclin PLC1
MATHQALNRAALAEFATQRVSPQMVVYLAQQAAQVISCEAHVTDIVRQHGQRMLPSTLPVEPADQLPPLPSIEAFIASLVDHSQVQVSILMCSLVYLGRLRARLPRVVTGMRCSAHRIFLASLIISAKILDDNSPKNKHWARYTMVSNFEGFGFSLPEVNSMEHELLVLLDWETHVTEEDIFSYLSPFLLPIRQRIQDQERQRKTESKKLEQELQQKQRNREWLALVILPFSSIIQILIENEGIVFMSQ